MGRPGIGRFRVNILRQRSSFMIVMRVIPFNVPTIAELSLPPVSKRSPIAERGMVLVTGVTGSGKSSTLAAMIHHVNLNVHKHIVTLEQPSSSCIATYNRPSRNAKSASTRNHSATACAPRCGRIPT